MTLSDICKSNDLSVAAAERALANLQAKGLISGYIPGDLHAEIKPTDQSKAYVQPTGA